MSGVYGLAGFTLAVGLLLQVGCGDSRRRANAELRTTIHQLQQELGETRLQVSELESQLREKADLEGGDAQLRANTPRVAAITLSSLSGMRREDDGVPTIELYVSATDGRGRPLQLVGTLDAVVRYLPVKGEERVLGRASLGMPEVRDAWRRGLGGVSYLVEIPLDQPIPASAKTLHAQVTHTDARTDVAHEASGPIRPTPPGEE